MSGRFIFGKSKQGSGGFTVSDLTPAFETTDVAAGIIYQRYENDDVSNILIIKINTNDGSTKMYKTYSTWGNKALATYSPITS